MTGNPVSRSHRQPSDEGLKDDTIKSDVLFHQAARSPGRKQVASYTTTLSYFPLSGVGVAFSPLFGNRQ